ncbi:MAG TPA: gamma carbonic anhydrase family protein [Gammaproteobacteria bacterium]|nr:gamma carbonic anhydrase family protein [Gammaproteobacteria bacterium]
MAVRSFEGRQPAIHASAWVDETALVIGEVGIGADSSIWPMSVVRGDINSIDIGSRTNIQDGSVLHVTHDSEFAPGGAPLVVGDEVTVGHRVVLHACTVGDRCLIGMGAVLLDGAVIGSGAIIGAGSLVPPNKELEGGYLYVGSPVKRVRELRAEEKRFLVYSAEHYVQLKNRHHGG